MKIVKLVDGLRGDSETGLFGPETEEPIYTIKLKGGYELRYRTAAELGYLVGVSGVKLGNPYDPINLEYDEFNEALWAAKEAKK